MAKNQHELQLAFDFQRPDTMAKENPNGTTPPQGGVSAIVGCRRAPAAIYCLEDRRAVKIAQEAAVHFSSILSLVAHIK